jgi:hypothetical protein
MHYHHMERYSIPYDYTVFGDPVALKQNILKHYGAEAAAKFVVPEPSVPETSTV